MMLNHNPYVVTPAKAGVHGLLAGRKHRRKLNAASIAASSRLRGLPAVAPAGKDDMGAFQLYRILL